MDSWMDPSNNQTTIHQNLKIGGPLIQCLSHGCLTPLNPHFDQPYLTWKRKGTLGRNQAAIFYWNGPRVQQLKSDLVNCKQERQGIVVYYGQLKSLWDELNNYDSIPNGRVTGHAPPQVGVVVGVDVVFSRIQVDDEDVEGLLELMQFKRQELMDRNSRMLIGAGEQRERLYFLKGLAPIRAYKTTSIASYELWHRRMGHPSSRNFRTSTMLLTLLDENRVVDFSADDEDPYMQNDIEEKQASVSDVKHEIDVEMGNNMEMATDGNTEVGDRGDTDVLKPMVSEEQFGKGKRVKQPSV
ncbi:hypothetical protein CK203_087687 [Vitis vinifera]|uniref:GAG-pre-integrase domain-containing protein n=1 Tax=Vitis vinifera TaxID=29760 RepID=A0A438DPH5_VITVI|nr:hypothetical protein CK203_087687 [Vitis vinifera]